MSEDGPLSIARRRALDPELAALGVLIPEIDIADVDKARALERDLVSTMTAGCVSNDVSVEDVACVGPDGSELRLRVYRPRQPARHALPALLFLHGGSFVMGGLDTEHLRCADYAVQAECAVVSTDYRLAPEHPFPAALEDCRTSFGWIVANAAGLGVDSTRLAVGGLSAGGALAAGVAAYERDTGGAPIRLQMLLFPVLDASMVSRSARTFIDTPVLTSRDVATMWELYLATDGTSLASELRRYASPADFEDISGLPATFLCTAEFDPLRDEALHFAQRLLHADVPVDLRHYARAYHSFDSFQSTRLGRGARRDQIDALRFAFT